MNDERFDELLEEIRQESVPPEQIKATQERVWRRLEAACSPACEEIRPYLTDYAGGELIESRRLLVHDHVSRCVECRRVLAAIKEGHKLVALPPTRHAHQQKWGRLAVAAGIVLAVLYIGRASIDSALTPSGPRATVAAVSGTLVDLSRGGLVPGAELSDGEVVRTAAGSRATLRLDDGSLVEMNERTELSVQGAWSGNTVQLERGDVIVQAADQGAGRLRVVTRDSVAAVRGTVFAVSSGAAGSLVSVLEGSVEVSQPGFEELLGAGQQAATHTAFGEVSVEEAISWSSEAETYAALLSGLIEIEERLAATPGLRYQGQLLPLLPQQTIAYFSFPNIEGAADETLDLLERTFAGDTTNERWSSDDARRLQEVLAHMQEIAPMLGEELVFVLTGESLSSEGLIGLVMAQVQSGREEDLESALEEFSGPVPYQVSNGILLVADNTANLALLSAQIGAGGSSPLAVEVGRRYRRGVGWLAALDVRAIDIDSSGGNIDEALGIDNMSYLFLEQRSGAVGDNTEAALMFDGPRSGVASWIGEPGPIGSVEYVSSQALIASAGSTRNPREAFDQLLALFGSGSDFAQELQDVELETGIDISNDVVASLGTDFAIAIEQISVPSPGWIAAFEVLNSGALEESMRRMVATINAEMDAENTGQRLILTQESVNGRTWSSLKDDSDSIVTLHWTYDRGYLIASTDRAFALRAIGVRDSGSSLVRSSAFQEQFPREGGLYSSGFFWLNVADVATDLATLVDEPNLNALADSRDPVLVVLTGETDQIRWASRTRFTSFLLDLLLAGPIGDNY